MQIVYDYQIFSLQRHGGISRYFYEIATRIARFDGTHVTILAMVHMNDYLRRPGPASVLGTYVPHVPKTGTIRRSVNRVLASRWLKQEAPDVLHRSYYSPSRGTPARSRIVVTVFDMIHEKFPQFFRRNDNTAEIKAAAVQNADRVICISEKTKADLVELLPVDPAKVSVVHLGTMRKPRSRRFHDRLIQDPYLLYVGERRGYKNFRKLLTAFATSPALSQSVRLACLGGGPLTRQECELIARLRLKEGSVIQLSGNDDVLANLYTHASALVYPSLYEGFGMPPLEAMSFQCPVVCSNTGSLPEVVGEAAELFDPFNIDSMIAAIERVLFSTARSAALRKLGMERLRHFSWDRCASQTHMVYQSML